MFDRMLYNIFGTPEIDRRIIYNAAIAAWGESTQMDKVEEELTELVLELKRLKTNRSNFTNVMSEMADVLIMVEQLMIIIHKHDPDALRQLPNETEYKLARLQERLSRI